MAVNGLPVFDVSFQYAFGTGPIVAEIARKVAAFFVDREDMSSKVALLNRCKFADVTLEDFHLVVD